MSRQLSNISRQLRQVSWLTLSALLIGAPLFGLSLSTHAAEAPGALTFVVKDQKTDRPLSSVQITITERETNSTQSVETDAQGRVVVEQAGGEDRQHAGVGIGEGLARPVGVEDADDLIADLDNAIG